MAYSGHPLEWYSTQHCGALADPEHGDAGEAWNVAPNFHQAHTDFRPHTSNCVPLLTPYPLSGGFPREMQHRTCTTEYEKQARSTVMEQAYNSRFERCYDLPPAPDDMSLSIPIELLGHVQLHVRRNMQPDNSLGFDMKPALHHPTPATPTGPGININFEPTTDDSGLLGLRVYTTHSHQNQISLGSQQISLSDTSDHSYSFGSRPTTSSSFTTSTEGAHEAQGIPLPDGLDTLLQGMGNSSFPDMNACAGFPQDEYMMEGDFAFSPSSLALANIDPLGRHMSHPHGSHQLGPPEPPPLASGMSVAHLPTPEFSTSPSPRTFKGNRPLKPSPTPVLPSPVSPLGAQEPTPPPSSSGRHPRQRRFPCPHPGCERSFTSEYTRRVHVEAHQPKEREILPCTMGCSEVFSRRHDRLRHEVVQHGRVCEYLCKECGHFFSSSKMLGIHKCRGRSAVKSRWSIPLEQRE